MQLHLCTEIMVYKYKAHGKRARLHALRSQEGWGAGGREAIEERCPLLHIDQCNLTV